jgi:hypothetical protein
VVNFVAEGTIEEKMLSILAFKKSLFAGVLDGGQSEIFLGGTRLNKFMESVDAVTRREEQPAVAAPLAVTAESAVATVPVPAPAVDGAERSAPDDNPWAPLLSVGLKLLESLAALPPRAAAGYGVGNGKHGNGKDGHGSTESSAGWIETDAATGRSVLKLPVPDSQVLRQLSVALSRLVAGLGG